MSLKVSFFASYSGVSRLLVVFLVVGVIATAIAVSYYVTTNQPTPNSSPTPIPSPEPTATPTIPTPAATPSPTPTVTPALRATLALKVTDTETEKVVDDVSIFIDGIEVGVTSQNGELEIENVEFGKHRISVGSYYEQEVTVSGDMVLPVSVDAPNPVLEAEVDVKADYITFRELGRVSITLTNTGQVASQNTIALVFVYVEPDLETPVTNRTLEFGNIEANAQPVTKEIVGIDSFVWPSVEHVAVVIIDQSKYIAETSQIISQEPAPPWFTAEILNHTHTYIEEHHEITGTITNIVLTR